ncbi:uncharacterized protein [Musca autumnalis]|uniref:uncharacterized protein n=1 Tax=Musca autumnalis TaxID=221902 RepID=UPI003CF8AE3C
MLLELILTFIAILVGWDYFHRKQKDAFLAKSNITGPKALPILGNALRLRNVNTENMETVIKENTTKYGKIYRFWVFHHMHLRVTDVKLCETLLSSQHQIKKSSFYDFLVDWLGRGLLLSNGKKWFTRRKIITPAFHFKILEQFVEVFDQQSTIMVNNLHAHADGKTAIDIFPVVCRMALDTISETAMGVKVHAQKNQEFEYVKALNYVSTVMSKRFVNPSQRTSILFKLTSPKIYKETQRCIEIMHKFTTQVIEKRREALEKSLREGNDKVKFSEEDREYGCKERMAFLDILLQSTVNGEPLSNEDIREEVDTFMFEGHDTTTSAMSFALYLIARHSEVQNRLFEEIKQIIGNDPNKVLTYRDLQEMKYLECVIKESLRLYPPVPAIGREITEDIALGDVVLPAKTNVILSFSLIMRDPDNYSDPDTFKPERFLADGECGPQTNPFVYTPFSAGPRNCIGQRFAMLEMKAVITKMLLHFELLPLGPDVQLLTTIVLRSKTGAHIGLRPRYVKLQKMLTLVFGVCLICLWMVDYLVRQRRNRVLSKSGIRGPWPTLPIIGNSWVALGNDTSNVFNLFATLGHKYGKVFRVWLFNELMLVTKDVKYFETILNSQSFISKAFIYDMLSPWLGDGLLLSTGSKWHTRRKTLTPTYHFKILEQFVEVFDQQSRVLVKRLYSVADGKTSLDIFPVICLTALDIITETAMGVKVNAQAHPEFPYAKAVKDATNVIATRAMKPVQYFQLGFLLTAFPSYLKLRKSIHIMHQFTDKVIADRKRKLESETMSVADEKDDIGQKRRMTFLDVLLQSHINGCPLTHEEIREEVDTFMFEGHDTTTSAISHCLYLLSRHPLVQQKVLEEIIDVMGEDEERSVNMRELQDLKYLDAVIKESLRLYPSVPIIQRYTDKDVEVYDQTIPAKSTVTLLVYALARDPDIFPNPDAFIPDRFFSNAAQKHNPFAYTPFSAGPRNCIGQKFAVLEMKSTISMVLRHFELLPLGLEVVPQMNIILRSATGINLGLRPRVK